MNVFLVILASNNEACCEKSWELNYHVQLFYDVL